MLRSAKDRVGKTGFGVGRVVYVYGASIAWGQCPHPAPPRQLPHRTGQSDSPPGRDENAILPPVCGPVVELADTRDLNSLLARGTRSSRVRATPIFLATTRKTQHARSRHVPCTRGGAANGRTEAPAQRRAPPRRRSGGTPSPNHRRDHPVRLATPARRVRGQGVTRAARPSQTSGRAAAPRTGSVSQRSQHVAKRPLAAVSAYSSSSDTAAQAWAAREAAVSCDDAHAVKRRAAAAQIARTSARP